MLNFLTWLEKHEDLIVRLQRHGLTVLTMLIGLNFGIWMLVGITRGLGRLFGA